MIKETSSKLLKELEVSLQEIAVKASDPLDRLMKSLNRIRDGLNNLKAIVGGLELDEQTEILLFKEIKPSFVCHQIFCTEMYTIETGFPVGDIERQISKLEEELAYGEHFNSRYAFLYQYYRLRMSEMDRIYFLRGAKCEDIFLPHGPDLDPGFSTACDYIFAKFRAFDMLKDWLHEKIAYLKSGNSNPLFNPATATEELFWTGDAINLAELGYGLVLSGQLNHGQANIAQVFRWLEEKLKISIGVPQKKFGELRARKRLSRTRFIDEMRENLIRKMDSDDAYQPVSVKKGFEGRN